jgi:hypothetical protein
MSGTEEVLIQSIENIHVDVKKVKKREIWESKTRRVGQGDQSQP